MNKSRKRALLIGPFSSSHFQVVVEAVSGFQLRIKFIPSDSPSSADLLLVTQSFGNSECNIPRLFKILSTWPYSYLILDKMFGMSWRSRILELHIKIFNPKIIHVSEIQRAGYSLGSVRNIDKLKKGKTIVTSSWGSDITLFSQLEDHKSRMKSVLEVTDFLIAERQIELDSASLLGFTGKFFSPIYTTVGLKHTYKNLSICSTRKIILIKGYQNFAGRALNALNALERCKDVLDGYEVIVYSPSADTKIEVELLRNRSGLDIRSIEKILKQEFLEYFAQARLYIGIGISDGLSTSMVEAMSAGTFPIQSENSAAKDFLKNGVNGFIVHPWDMESLESCITRAILDDKLVDNAQILNREIIAGQYNYRDNLAKLRQIYEEAL